MLDATELRRASATDAAAVQQYLQSIDSDDLNALLDQFADAESKKKDDADAHEWLALVHVLLRTQATRQRTATRIIQSLWRGNASEMEALRWVTEISLGYMASVSQAASAAQSAIEASTVAKELDVVLQIVFKFVRDTMAPPSATESSSSSNSSSSMKKTLPQLLALVPVLLNLLVDVSSRGSTDGEGAVDAQQDCGVSEVLHEHVVQLLELPWELQSVAFLLELLREHSSLVSLDGWTLLRESVQQLVSQPSAQGLPTDSFNPLIRECILLAAAQDTDKTQAVAWITLARVLVRRLPPHLRQEAEFNVQMCLHQCPSLASQLCNALLLSRDGDQLTLDTSDAVLLLHTIRASKPMLHHHLISSSLVSATSDINSVFSKAQTLMKTILESELSTGRTIRHTVTSIIEFGGRQPHTRVWKAQLLHEVSRFWMDYQNDPANIGAVTMESVFYVVPEVREEVLQGLVESTRVQAKAERALAQLGHLVRDHASLVAPYGQRIEDWISSLAHTTHAQHQGAMLAASFQAMAPLVATLRDFFNFAMVLLRKQLSSPYSADRMLAIDVWCTWLENGLAMDAQQEEEVVLAIKHAIELSQQRVGVFQRLKRVFKRKEALLPASLAEFHGLLATTLGDFLDRATEQSGDFEDEYADIDGNEGGSISAGQDRALRRFEVTSLDHFFAQDGSISSALELGSLLESVVACLVGVERFVELNPNGWKAPLDDTSLGADILRWADMLTRHREEFFLWVSSGRTGSSRESNQPELRVTDKRFPWALAARVGLGCAFCDLVLRRQLEESAPSVKMWELVELQLCLMRLWRKFTASTPLPSVSASMKDQLLDTKILQATARTVGMHGARILTEMTSIVTRSQLKSLSSVASSSASLDAMLFVLDAYIESLSRRQHTTQHAITSEWEGLLAFYSAVADSSIAFNDGGDSLRDPASAVFTTYAETLASQFPKSMRHLVVSDSATSVVVTLDAKASDETLSRVCVALSKALDAMSAAGRRVTSGDVSLISRLLSNLKRVMDLEAFSKYRVTCVTLIRRLVQQTEHKGDDDVADLVYSLLCDHVVHQLPLLRGLLALSFPTAASLSGRFEAVLDRATSVLDSCGFLHNIRGESDVAAKKAKKANTVKAKPSTQEAARVRRKRLRQITDAEDDEPEEEGRVDGEDVGEEKTEATKSGFAHDTTLHRAPRLTTAAAQAAALFAALSTIEGIHSLVTHQWLTAAKAAKTKGVGTVDDGTLLHASRIHTLLASTVFVSIDISWTSSRALSKLLSLLESAVRVGKSCSVAAPTSSETQRLQVFKSSVHLAVRGRAWLSLLREATSNASARSRLSATILKLDVYLLDAPTLVTSLLKSASLSPDAKRSLRAFLSTVEMALATSTAALAKPEASSDHSTKSGQRSSSSKRHLVGVVPIIHKKRRKRLRSRHPFIDSCLVEEDGDDAYADLEDFIA